MHKIQLIAGTNHVKACGVDKYGWKVRPTIRRVYYIRDFDTFSQLF